MEKKLISLPSQGPVFQFSREARAELPLLRLMANAGQVLDANDRAHDIVKQAVSQREYKKYVMNVC